MHPTESTTGPRSSIAERFALTSAGGLLAWYGVRQGGAYGWAAAAFGGYLAWRGLTRKSALLRLHDYGAAGEARLEVVPRAGTPAAPALRVHRSLVIDRPAGELFAFWRDFRNLPRLFPFLAEVRVLDNRRSHWRLAAPGGLSAEWDAEIQRDEPGRLIAWHSLPPAAIPNRGTVEFLPAAAGAEVSLSVEWEPPAGELGRELAGAWDPGAVLEEGLRRWRQLLESPATTG